MRADAAALQSSGADYGEFPMLSNDFKSAYVPVRTIIFHLIQMPFQLDPDVPVVREGIATC